MSLLFSETAWGKICALVDHNTEEVGWFGVTKQITKDRVEVIDIFVPEQGVCPVEWVAGKEAMADMQLEDEVLDLLEEGYKLNYMGHSHVDMGVSPSAQDESYIDFLLEDAPEMDYVLFTTIHNKRRIVSGQASLVVTGLGRMSTDVDITYTQSKYQSWAQEQTKKHVSKLPPAQSKNPPKYGAHGNTYAGHNPSSGYPNNTNNGGKGKGGKGRGRDKGKWNNGNAKTNKGGQNEFGFADGFASGSQSGHKKDPKVDAQASLNQFNSWAEDEASEWRANIAYLEAAT